MNTRWYLQRFGDADVVQLVVEEVAEPRRGLVAMLQLDHLRAMPRGERRELFAYMRTELARRISGADQLTYTYDPEET